MYNEVLYREYGKYQIHEARQKFTNLNTFSSLEDREREKSLQRISAHLGLWVQDVYQVFNFKKYFANTAEGL